MMQNNEWVGYIDRSREQMETNILTRLGNQVPEISDHSPSSPWRKMIGIWTAIMELLHYYVDNRAREAFLPRCRKLESAILHARTYDYRVRGKVASSVDLKFTLNVPATQNVVIPENSRVQTSNGLIFSTLETVTIVSGQDEVSVAARQWEKVENEAIQSSDGSADQQVVLPVNLSDMEIGLLVDGEQYSPVDTLVFSNATDRHFVPNTESDGTTLVTFGDGINGTIPLAGQDFIFSYYLTSGRSGNVSSNAITEVIDTPELPPDTEISVTNQQASGGGTDMDSLNTIRKNVTAHLRSIHGVVTREQFRRVPELAPGVSKSNYEYDGVDNIKIYIVPEGGGVASTAIINDTTAFVDQRASILTEFKVLPAGQINIILSINVFLREGFLQSQIRTTLETLLLDFFDSSNQEIGGSVHIGQIYELIQSVRGVNHGVVESMQGVPYPEPLNTSNPLTWLPVQDTDANQESSFIIQFIDSSSFELFVDGNFVGIYNIDQKILFAGLTFTVYNNNYQEGDRYRFNTYTSTGSIILREPSLPVLNPSGITLNLQGGIRN